MIRQSKFATVKTIFGKFIFTALVWTSASNIQAQSVEKMDSGDKSASIKYLGISDEMFLFDVRFNNPTADKFLFEIVESSNNSLFKEIYRDKLFVKKFKIPTDLGELKFVIRNLKDNSLQTFLVNRSQRVLEDVVVKKLNH